MQESTALLCMCAVGYGTWNPSEIEDHEVHTGAQAQALTCLAVDGEGRKTRETRARFVPERRSETGERDVHSTTVGRLKTRAARARFRFIDQTTRDNGSVHKAGKRSPMRASGTRSTQMQRLKMRAVLARFQTGAGPQSRDRPTVRGGQHPRSPLSRRSFVRMNRSKLREDLARFQRRRPCKRASYAFICMAANRSAIRTLGTRSTQMKRPKMRGGIARFRTGARWNHETGPLLVEENI